MGLIPFGESNNTLIIRVDRIMRKKPPFKNGGTGEEDIKSKLTAYQSSERDDENNATIMMI